MQIQNFIATCRILFIFLYMIYIAHSFHLFFMKSIATYASFTVLGRSLSIFNHGHLCVIGGAEGWDVCDVKFNPVMRDVSNDLNHP